MKQKWEESDKRWEASEEGYAQNSTIYGHMCVRMERVKNCTSLFVIL